MVVDAVTRDLSRLVTAITGLRPDDRSHTKLVEYSLRVSSSGIGAGANRGDPLADIEAELTREGRPGDALQASRLALPMRRHGGPLRDRGAPLLTLLHKISRDCATRDKAPARAMFGAPAGAAHRDDPVDPEIVPRSNALAAPGSAAGAATRSLDPRTESLLVRDMIFTFGGSDAELVAADPRTGLYRARASSGLSASATAVVRALGEVGWLRDRVHAFAAREEARAAARGLEAAAGDAGGLVGQALRSAVRDELARHAENVAELRAAAEGSWRGTEACPEHQGAAEEGCGGGDSGAASGAASGAGSAASAAAAARVTLKRLLVWSRAPLRRLRALATLCDAAPGLKGGALASALDRHRVSHGDAETDAISRRVTNRSCAPFLEMLTRWITEGELEDPHEEFFITCDASAPDAELWYGKYAMQREMRPAWLPPAVLHEILLVGKSLNFVRRCCGEPEWVSDAAAGARGAAAVTYAMGPGAIESLTRRVGAATHAQATNLLLGKYRLLDHILAVKSYLFLGKGDFVQYLMDLAEDDLSRPAGSQFRHNLVNVVDAAVRSSTARYDPPDVLARLDVLVHEAQDGDTGWDVFSLTYAVDAPVSTVLHPKVMDRILRVHRFLWDLKRVEHALSGAWQRMMQARNAFRHAAGPAGAAGSLGPYLTEVNLVRSRMSHLVSNVQYYVMFEALEASHKELLAKLDDPPNVDAVIAAHDAYVSAIEDRAMLGHGSAAVRVSLRSLFELVSRFVSLLGTLCDSAESAHEADTERSKARQARGEWGRTEDDDGGADAAGGGDEGGRRAGSGSLRVSPASRAELASISAAFEDGFDALLVELASHGSEALRLLSFRLDYSEYYRGKRAAEDYAGASW